MKRIVAVILVVVLAFCQFTTVLADTGWQQIGDPNPGETTDFMIDPENANHLIVTSFYGSLKQSWDGGKTWEDVWGDAPRAKDTGNMLTTNLYWVGGKWFFNSWNAIHSTTDFTSFTTVVDAYFVAGKNNTIDSFWTDGIVFYIGLRPAEGSVGNFFWVSSDGGKTWNNLSLSVLRAANKDPLGYCGVKKIKVFKEVLFVYVPSNIADSWYFSVDGGINFKKLASVCWLFPLNDCLLGTGPIGVYRSDDGLSWSMIYGQNIPTNSFAYDNVNKILYVVDAFKGVFYSRDEGKSWTIYSQGFSDKDFLNYTYHQLLRMPGYSIIRIYNNQLYLLMNTHFYKRLVVQKETIIVLQVDKPTFTANGVSFTLDSPPIIKNGRTLVPIRAIVESLGGAVTWDESAKKVTVSLEGVTIELWLGKNTAKANGVSVRIDAANPKVVPEIINGRTMLPLRFISEGFGCLVSWIETTRTITITH